jgi:hypothetical protein
MKTKQRPRGFWIVLALMGLLALNLGLAPAARAASEDVAMFYDDLSQYGQWVDYEKYGPVWRPSQVSEDWRPYTDGRWVPTQEGNVFETQEPWGYATYHYGNWMPTQEYGWVWVPGRTWYPSTVEWRSSPETASPDASYIGWAPTPPPDYVPPPSYAPPSYYQGAPVTESLTSPLWIFVKAAEFLLGLGQPYAPAYSYAQTGYLVPPVYVPVVYAQTVIVPTYVTPTYYPPAWGRRFGPGYYSMGPPVGYLGRVTRYNQAVIGRQMRYNSMHFNRIHSVVPPSRVMSRHAYLRQIMPPALAQGRPLPAPRRSANIRTAQVHLNRPNMVPAPRGVPRVTAQIPRVQPGTRAPGQGLRGTALPPRSTMRMTPQMTKQVQQLPAKQRFVPAGGRTFTPVAASSGPRSTTAGGKPGPGTHQPGTAQPGSRTAHPSGFSRTTQGPTRITPGSQRPTSGTTRPGAVTPQTSRQRPGQPQTRQEQPQRQRQTQQQQRQRQLQQQQQRQRPQQQQQRQQQMQQQQQRQRQMQQQQQRQRQQQMQRQPQQQRRPQQIQRRPQQQQQQQQRQQPSRRQPQKKQEEGH